MSETLLAPCGCAAGVWMLGELYFHGQFDISEEISILPDNGFRSLFRPSPGRYSPTIV